MDMYIYVLIVLGTMGLMIGTPIAVKCIRNIMLMRRQEKAWRRFRKDVNKLIETATKESDHKMTMEELENLK